MLWIFPTAFVLLVLVVRGCRCDDCFGSRRSRRLVRARARDFDPFERGYSSESSSSSEVGRSIDVRDDDVRAFVRALSGTDLYDEERPSYELTARERREGFDPSVWRQLAVSRELERYRQRAANDDLDNASTHRQQVSLTRRVKSREASRVRLCGRFRAASSEVRDANGHVASGSHDRAGDECAICCENFEDEDVVVVLRCAHAFHDHCAIPWLRMHATCPICRMDVNRMSLLERHDVFTRRRPNSDRRRGKTSPGAGGSFAA
ncbi:hypothetical protein BE221DRAFT_81038 [Ostreococcus tauri]|uniref:RING-type E3 ubiquitin transferase n=1 Tax=Ostreococcus tauri TaxID=70448 RepID=A0A1Y5I1H2_OSTTA|nr:hypothetical protein BE221DRAFT_81038 [Ostreococcus tauri]